MQYASDRVLFEGAWTEEERAFVEAAAPYGERKGISYKAWREVGVPAAVLKRAGIRAETINADAADATGYNFLALHVPPVREAFSF